MKIFKFILIFLIIDLLLSQIFLLKILDFKTENFHRNDLENRIFNKDYKYTFKPNVTYTSKYLNYFYEISTNDLGFRDRTNKNLDLEKKYNIVIGDSFVEGVGLPYNDTLVGLLNELYPKKIYFLNAGVASYSTYIYLKKIESILNEYPKLKIERVYLLLDKSDILDDLHYINHQGKFTDTKGVYKNLRKQKFFNDLFNLNFWSFLTSQTISGILIKKITDFLETLAGNLHKRFVLAKVLNKSFFSVNKQEISSLKSINNRKFISNTFNDELWWNKEGVTSINFSIKNLIKLKELLDDKKIELNIILYPWAFELIDDKFKNKYSSIIKPLLEKNNLKYYDVYQEFIDYRENIYETIGSTFLYEDIHYNKSGYKILADFIIKN